MNREIAKEIVLNTLTYIDKKPAAILNKVCERLFKIDNRYNLGLYHAINYHLVKDDSI